MNKNLIYFSINENYLECLKYNLKHLNEIKGNFDVCCILPQKIDSNLEEIKKLILPDIDLHYSRFLIFKWEEYIKYDNFLYLDADAFLIKSPDKIFQTINSQPNIIHGVKEKNDISMSDDPFFRFTNEKIDNAIGYNSGTFGFNKSNSDVFSEFIDYAILNKNKTLNDQSLYNEFFNIKKIISPTLSEFVYLDHPVGNYYYTNKNDAAIIHFLGNYGNAGYKLNKIKQELEKNI